MKALEILYKLHEPYPYSHLDVDEAIADLENYVHYPKCETCLHFNDFEMNNIGLCHNIKSAAIGYVDKSFGCIFHEIKAKQ